MEGAGESCYETDPPPGSDVIDEDVGCALEVGGEESGGRSTGLLSWGITYRQYLLPIR